MNWFNAALHWLWCTLRRCHPNGKHNPRTHSAIAADSTRLILHTDDQAKRLTDTRACCSVYLSVNVSTHHQRLSQFLEKIHQATHHKST